MREPVMAIDCSPDGRHLICGFTKTVIVYDPINNCQVGSDMVVYDILSCVKYSPNGQLVAVGADDFKIHLFEEKTRLELNPLCGHQDEVYSVDFTKDGQHLVSGGKDKTIRIWDLSQQLQIGKISLGPQSIVCSVIYSPDQKQILAAGTDSQVIICNTRTMTQIHQFQGHKRCVVSAKYLLNVQLIVSGDVDCRLKYWDRKSCKQLRGWKFDDLIRSIDCSPNSTLVVFCTSQDIFILDLVTGNQQFKSINRYHRKAITAVMFSRNGNHIISSSSDQTIKIQKIQI